MSPLTSSPLCSTLLFVGIFVFVSTEQENITGENVTLTCRAPDINIIKAVKWSRTDLGDEYVLLYRGGRIVPDNQHPSFKNRVDLKDRQMKDGDVSLILKNVTINDTGTYECGVVQSGAGGLTPISVIPLRVAPPPPPPPGPTRGTSEDGGKEDGGSIGLIVGLIVSALILVIVAVGFCIYKKCGGKKTPRKASSDL